MKKEIANRIKSARENAGFTVVDIHNRLKVTRQTVYNWEESGEIREEALEKFCKLTKTEPAFIRYGITDAAPQEIGFVTDWDKLQNSYVFAYTVENEYHDTLLKNNIEPSIFIYKVMEWKYKELSTKANQNEAEKMTAFSKFIQNFDFVNPDKEKTES